MSVLNQTLVERLAPEALRFSTAGFQLSEDLEHLEAVRAVNAPEAVIFYCARILDALAADAITLIGQEPSPNVFANLQLLEQFNRLGRGVLYWAHALRRLGNAVRHLHGRVGIEEAVLSLLFAESWLEWYSCRFSHGQRLGQLTRDAAALSLGGNEECRELFLRLEELENSGGSIRAAAAHWDLEPRADVLGSPVLPAVLAEVLLGRQQSAAAWRVLDAALASHPEDDRLRQLMGLYWSREGNYDRALLWLEPLPRDDETAGILGGVFKRRWMKDQRRKDDLQNAYRAYRDVWRATSKKIAYLGVNTAAIALWLGRPDEARDLAGVVEDLLRRRAESLKGLPEGPTLALNYWDQVSLAEALLLQERHSEAGKVYREAFAAHRDRRGDIAVTRWQMKEICKTFKLPADLA